MTYARSPRLGSRRTLGLPAFLLTVPIGIVAALTATRDPFASLLVFCEWLVTGALAQGALGLGLLVGWRVTRERTGAALRATVIGFALLAGALRGVVVALMPIVWDLPSTSTPVMRIASSSVVFAVWLIAIGATLEENARHREQVSSMLAALAEREVRERLARAGSPIAASAQQRIADTASSVGAALQPLAAERNYERLAREVREAVDERIRPLSHELWATPVPDLEHRLGVPAFLNRVLRTPVSVRVALPVMSVLLVLNSAVWHGWLRGLAVGGSAAVVSAVIVLAARGPWSARQPARTHALMYMALLILPTAVAQALLREFTQSPVPGVVTAVMAVGIPVAFGLSAAAATVVDDRRAMLGQLRARIDDDTWNRHLDALEQHSANVDAAAFLHNRLQSRLTAAAIQLEQAAAERDIDRAEAAMEAAREALRDAEGQRHPGETPLGRLRAMARAWEGIATVTVGVDDDDLSCVDAHAVTECIEEAVANAVRHGHATSVTVSARALPDGLEVTVDDNGIDWATGVEPGFGLRRLNALTGEPVQLTRSDAGTRLRMRFSA